MFYVWPRTISYELWFETSPSRARLKSILHSDPFMLVGRTRASCVHLECTKPHVAHLGKPALPPTPMLQVSLHLWLAFQCRHCFFVEGRPRVAWIRSEGVATELILGDSVPLFLLLSKSNGFGVHDREYIAMKTIRDRHCRSPYWTDHWTGRSFWPA